MGIKPLARLFACGLVSGMCLGNFTVQGAVRTWIGASGTWNDGAANNAKWSGFDEPDTDDDAVIDSATVVMGTSNSVATLTVSNNGYLSTLDQSLSVTGATEVTGFSTDLIVGGSATQFTSGSVKVDAGGKMDMEGGVLSVIDTNGNTGTLRTGAAGTVSGFGSIVLNQLLTSNRTLFINEGTLEASHLPRILLNPPIPDTLSIFASDVAYAAIDLDGLAGQGNVVVAREQTLDINVRLADAFGGTMSMYQNSKLDMYLPWSMDNGTLTVMSGSTSVLPVAAAGIATIAGADFTQSGGTILVDHGDATLRFTAPYELQGGVLDSHGKIEFSGNDTRFQSGSMVKLATSEISTDASLFFHGGLQIATGVASELKTPGDRFLEFLPTSQTTLNGNLLLNSGNTEISAGAQFSGAGSLQIVAGSHALAKDGSDIQAKLVNQGSFRPGGFGVGHVNLKAFEQSSSGRFIEDISDATASGVDLTVTSGQATIGGTLDLKLVNGFTPSTATPPQTIFMANGGIVGQFSKVVQPANIPLGLHYYVTYTPNAVQLTLGTLGDLNLDGNVDAADAAILFGSWGPVPPGNALADLTGDQMVDAADAGLMFAFWTGDSGPVSVPEPTTAGLGVMAVWFTLARRRRQQQLHM